MHVNNGGLFGCIVDKFFLDSWHRETFQNDGLGIESSCGAPRDPLNGPFGFLGAMARARLTLMMQPWKKCWQW